MTHPHGPIRKKTRPRPRPRPSKKRLTVKKSLRQAQRISVGVGKKAFKARSVSGRRKGITGRTGLARALRRRDRVRGGPTRRPRHAGPPKVGFRTVKGRGGKRITIKRPRPRSA